MSSKIKGHKIIKRLLLVIGIIFFVTLAANWLLTYKLEDTLRRRLRSEVIKASNGFYDCSFDKLKVDFLTGELMIKGLTVFPDSITLGQYKSDKLLPNIYFDIFIDTIDFKGVNLTWTFDYSKLTFQEFLVRSPDIKIVSPAKEYKKKRGDPSDLAGARTLYESVSSFFDVIQSKYISLLNADVEYLIEDSIAPFYSLKEFEFTAYDFQLDKFSQSRDRLLYSEDFYFTTTRPQTIFSSEFFLFDISNIELSTIDSIVHIGGAHFKSKEKYWDRRLTREGSYNNIEIGDFKLEGIQFSRDDVFNLLDARRLSISKPSIEFYRVKDENHSLGENKETQPTDSLITISKSLYDMTSPIMERISIDKIAIDDAQFLYVRTEDGESDRYTLGTLNFSTNDFIVDSLHQFVNVVNYLNQFELNASQVEGEIPAQNVAVNVDYFRLSSVERILLLSDIELSPLSTLPDRSRINGNIDSIKIAGMNYNEGLEAALFYIKSPKIDYIKAKKSKTKEVRLIDEKKRNKADQILHVVAPFVRYLSVRDIIIDDADISLTDKSNNNKYTINQLNFSAKNFHIDEETTRLADYFFRWDEYKVRFRNFDNLTPDRKYRIQVSEGNFNSVTKDIYVKDLKVIPQSRNDKSSISLSTPFARLLGWDEKALKNKALIFDSFVIESPQLKVERNSQAQMRDSLEGLGLEIINFNTLRLSEPIFSYSDTASNFSMQAEAFNQVEIDSFRWERNKELSIENISLSKPNLFVIDNGKDLKTTDKLDLSFLGDIYLGKLNIAYPTADIIKNGSRINFKADNYLLDSLLGNMQDKSSLKLKNSDLTRPTLSYIEQEDRKTNNVNPKGALKNLASSYVNQTEIERFNISNLNLLHTDINQHVKNKLVDTNFQIEGLQSCSEKDEIKIEELAFDTKDIDIPIDSGFYTLKIRRIDFSKKKGELNLDKISLVSNYPKFEFSYLHPKRADWFDVEIGRINLSGLDVSKFLTDTIITTKKMLVDYAVLQNLKNQKIRGGHNLVPLFYEQFQKFPIKYHIEDFELKDFTVIYEELHDKASIPASLPFSRMNGQIRNFTNIQTGRGNYYTLHADGLAMGVAPFTAAWKMPVDSLNDQFFLSAQIKDLDMKDLNQLVHYTAPAYLDRGYITSLKFDADATSLGADVDLSLAYDSLYIVLTKGVGDKEENKLLTKIANQWFLEERNRGNKMRRSHKTIVRDPYHSNFNYFWQMLQPTMKESVGITEEKENVVNNLFTLYNKIKKFFGGGKKDKKESEN